MTDRRITRITAENFMRLKAVDISPEGNVIYITGANGEGKTSVLNAICATLNWRDASGSIPEPIHKGQSKAVVTIDLGDMTVTRTWTGSGTQLKVESKDGSKYPTPQAMLDQFFSRIGFDPLEFIRMQPRDQRKTLIDLLKIDFTQFEEERVKLLADKNTITNKISAFEQNLPDITAIPDDTPDKEISAIDILRDIDKATTHNDELRHASDEYGRITRECLRLEDQINELKENLQKKMSERDNMPWVTLQNEEPIDINPLKEKLTTVEQVNKQIREKHNYNNISAKISESKKCLASIINAISCIDQDKRDALEAAKFPVSGLTFDESGVLFQGVPLKQASSAEQIRVSLAIGIAMNPSLKFLIIRDGSLLDTKSRALIADMASDHNMQVFIEAVDESGCVGFVIDDGQVNMSIPPVQREIT